MLKKVLFLLIPLWLMFSMQCKEIPTEPTDPEIMNGEIEIMYKRIQPVINPTANDPTAATFVHSKYGGKNSSKFILVEENTFLANVYLASDGQPYFVDLVDPKILPRLTYKCIARKIFLRLKKEGSSWLELKCIVPNQCGEAAKFLFYLGQIQNPTRCE